MKRKITILFIIMTFLFIICFLLFKENNGSITLIINNEEYIINKTNINESIDLKTLANKYPLEIKVKLKNAKLKYENKNIKNNETITIDSININKDNYINLKVKLTDKYETLTINTLPSTFPSINTEGNGTSNYEYYLTTYITEGKHYIYTLDNEGNITFYKETLQAFNFKKNIIDNKVYYTYLETINGRYDGFNDALPTKLIVLDEHYQKIKEIMNDENINTENHDYLFLGLNHYIIGSYTKEDTVYHNQKIKVWNFKLKEVIDDKVLWEFSSLDNPKLLDYYINEHPFSDKAPVNYMHFNSIIINPKDNNIICSFRNQSAIIKINRSNGKIMWILGGIGDEFNLKESQKFAKQHSISLIGDNELLLYDNGENKTRVLKIKIDENKKKITSFKSYDLNIFMPRMGAVKYINDSKYLVTYGLGNYKYAFSEINLDTLKTNYNLILKNNSLYNVNIYKID